MATADDVAAFIIEQKGSLTTYELQKLAYYAQAWSLVWDRAPLFAEPVEAWTNGPAIPTLFAKSRGKRRVDSWPGGSASNLSTQERETVAAIVEFYGQMDGNTLRALTHREDPWVKTRQGLAPDERTRREVTHDTMRSYFGKVKTNGKRLPEALMQGIRVLLSLSEAQVGSLFTKTDITMDEMFSS